MCVCVSVCDERRRAAYISSRAKMKGIFHLTFIISLGRLQCQILAAATTTTGYSFLFSTNIFLFILFFCIINVNVNQRLCKISVCIYEHLHIEKGCVVITFARLIYRKILFEVYFATNYLH